MVKKCVVCGKKAAYKIKDLLDYYCEECAEDSFSDLNLLVKVEEEAQILKELVKVLAKEKVKKHPEQDERK